MTVGANDVTLDSWQRRVTPRLERERFRPSSIGDVTLLAYFFWDDDRIRTKFYTIKNTFLCAFHSLGLLPSKLVVNRQTDEMAAFCGKYGIDIDLDPTLTGGLPRMSRDCIQSLHERFSTRYVLIIQADGIVVRPGLERFLGMYDYVGAPWPGHMKWFDWFPYPQYAIGNGGLCLRSRAICQAASEAYRRVFRHLPYSWFLCDDVFYGKTMRFLSPSWRRRFRYPTVEEALLFSTEGRSRNFELPETPPMGFHNPQAFREYVGRYGIPLRDFYGEDEEGPVW